MFKVEGRRLPSSAESPGAEARASAARWRLFGLAATALLGGLVYANSLSGDFVWDDRKLIVDDRAIKSWAHLGDIFSHDFFERNEDDLPYGYYRPVTTVSYLIDYSVWRLQPFGYHLTNVLLHSACTVLVGLVLLRLGWSFTASLIAAALFAVHPLHAENVAWIAGRTDLLAFFFSATSLLLHLYSEPVQVGRNFQGDGRVRDPSSHQGRQREVAPLTARRQSLGHLSVLAFALALSAKEMAVVLVAWLALIHLLAYRQDWRHSLRAVEPFIAIIGLYVVWRFKLVDVPLPGTAPSHQPLAVLLSAGPTVIRYLGWLVLPIDLNAYVQNPYVVSPLDPRFIGSVVVLAVAVWMLSRYGPNSPRLVLAAAMLAVSFLPILNFVRVAAPSDMGNVMAERFCYFPSFPFVALIGLAVATVMQWPTTTPSGRHAIAGGIAVAILLGALATVRRNRAWHDDLTFLTTTLERSPTAVLLWGNLAVYHLRKHQLDEGTRALERAVALDPKDYWVRSAQALWYVVSGRHAEAIPIQHAIAADAKHGHAPALNNLAYLYRVTGQEDQALQILEQLVNEGTAYADVYFNLAEIYRRRNRLEDARAQYRLALDERPNNRPIATAWAAFELDAGQPEEAERIYRSLLAIYPNDTRVLNNLALIRHRTGDTQSALDILGQVVAREPGYVNARINYAEILRSAGRSAEAVAQLETAQRLAKGTDLEQVAARSLQDATANKAVGPPQTEESSLGPLLTKDGE